MTKVNIVYIWWGRIKGHIFLHKFLHIFWAIRSGWIKGHKSCAESNLHKILAFKLCRNVCPLIISHIWNIIRKRHLLQKKHEQVAEWGMKNHIFMISYFGSYYRPQFIGIWVWFGCFNHNYLPINRISQILYCGDFENSLGFKPEFILLNQFLSKMKSFDVECMCNIETWLYKNLIV